MSKQVQLLARVRQTWSTDIDPASAWLEDLGAGVIRTYRALSESGSPPTDEQITDAVWSSEQGVQRQRKLAAEVFEVVAEREATQDELHAMRGGRSVDELESLAECVLKGGPVPESEEAAAEHPPLTQSAPPEAAEVVDWAWMDAFHASYGRQPSVPEYMHLRGRAEPLDELAAATSTAFARMAQVHEGYLGDSLDIDRFVREYVPGVFDRFDDVLQGTIQRVTDSAEYAAAMSSRLSHLHEMHFGTPLCDADAAYAFESRVRSQRLPLTTDALNDVVTDFHEMTEAHGAAMASVYNDTLGRAPAVEEVLRRRAAFREDETAARAALLRDLVGSLEFADVVKREIVSQAPDMSTPLVFATLDRVLAMDLIDRDIAAIVSKQIA
jgi:hypothetical protein